MASVWVRRLRLIGLAALMVMPLGVTGAPSEAAVFGSWSTDNPATVTPDLRGVSCIDALVDKPAACVAVGFGGTIIRKDPTTASAWSSESSGTTNNLLAVSCSDSTNCVAVGENGTIVRLSLSVPPVTTWTVVTQVILLPQINPLAPTPTLTAPLLGVSCKVNVCFAVGGSQPSLPDNPVTGLPSAPFILVSLNFGQTWVQQVAPPVTSLAAVDCSTPVTCVATAYGNRFLWTSDGGATWILGVRPEASDFDVVGVSCPAVTFCVAVDNGGVILNSSTAGAVWTNSFVPTLAPPNAMFGVDCESGPPSLSCFAVGGGGTIMKTTNFGPTNTWSSDSLAGFSTDLHSVSCTISTCRAVGDAGKILKN